MYESSSRFFRLGAIVTNPGLRAGLIIGCAAAWFVCIIAVTSSFTDATALAAVRSELAYIPEILTRVPRNASYVLAVGVFIVSGAGVGDLILAALRIGIGGRVQRLAFALMLGIAAWTIALMVVGYAGLLSRAALYPLLAVGLLVTLYRVRKFMQSQERLPEPPASRWFKLLLGTLAILLVLDMYVALLGALMPEVQYDARFYHLAEALRYALHGRLFDLIAHTRVLQFGWPQYQEILYSGVIVLFGLPAAKVLSWYNLVLAVLTIFAFSIEFFQSRRIGLLAAAIFASTPIVAWSAATAGNDLMLAPYTVLSVFAFLRWNGERGSWRWAALSGVLAGFAFGIKPFGAFNVIALAVIMLGIGLRVNSRRIALRALLPFLAGCLLMAMPNLIRSAIVTGDPFFPALGGLFHAKYLTPSISSTLSTIYQAYGADTSWPAFFLVPWNVTVHSDQFRNIIGPIYLWALPFVLIASPFKRENPVLRLLVLYGVLWLFLWYAARTTEMRYAETIMPFGAIVIAYLASPRIQESRMWNAVRGLSLILILAGIILNTQFLVPFQRHAMLQPVSGLELLSFPYLYEGEPERDVQLQYVPMLEYINAYLRRDKDKVYDAADGIVFNSYSTIDLYNGVQFGGPGTTGEWNLFSPDAYDRLRRNDITYVMMFNKVERPLRRTPLFRHLQLVHRTPASALYADKAAYGVQLYRVR